MEVRSETSVQAAEIEAMVKARCALARYSPRDIDVVRQKLLRDCERPIFADKAIYSKPVGREDIEGPSVRMAETVARHMGNMLIDATIAEETHEKRRIRVYAMDLETNTTASADVVISKTIERKDAKDREVVGERTNSYGAKVFIVIATEDELLNKTNAAVSKMRRNKILELTPADIIEEAMLRCNETLTKGDAADPEGARKRMVDAFFALGVKADELKAYVGHALDTLTPTELNQLRRVHNSIRDNEATWRAIVEAKEAKAAANGPQSKAPPAAKAATAAAAKEAPKQEATPPHNPQTGEVVEPPPVNEDAAEYEAMKAVLQKAEAAKATEAVKTAPPPAPPAAQGQLGIDFSAGDATEQVKVRMQAVADDPQGTVEQLMKVARLADSCPPERRTELGKLTVALRAVINGRKPK